ncbi:MAG: DMT family transporter [Verrucomicrobiales bacterium]|nr:DMT family transporter [Verrucomicrobiales bacterium]
MRSHHDGRVSLRHLIAVIGGALFIAFAPIFAVLSTRGENGVGMWDAAFWRVFFGAVSLGFLFLFQRRRILPTRKDFGFGHAWLWLPGLAFALDFWAWHWSFENTSVANATLLANTAILWVTLFAWFFWKERITKGFFWGTFIAGAGMVVLLLSSTRREPPTDGNPVLGDFLALFTALFYATYQLSMKYYRRQHSASVLMFWASALAAVLLLPLALLHEAPFFPGSAMMWLPLLGLGVISHFCGQGLIAYGLGGVPASLASVTLLIQPVATAVLGVGILGQVLVPWQVVGAGIVVAGLFLAIRGRISRTTVEP